MKTTDVRAPLTLFAAFLHFDVSFMVWVLLGPLALFIAKDLHLTVTQKGLLVGLPALGGAFFRIILGTLSDHFGPKRVGVVSMLVTLVPLGIGWLFGDSVGAMLFVGLLLGIPGASFAVSLPLASRWYPPERQGIAMGIAAAGNAGSVLAALFAPRIAATVGWHATMGLTMIPVLLTFAIFAFCASESPAQPAPRTLREHASVLAKADTWWFSLFYSITFGGFVGYVSYLALFFNAQYGVDKVAVGGLVAIAALAGSCLRPLGGYLADRIGGVAVLRAAYAGVALCALGIAALPSLAVCKLLVFALLGMLGIGNGAVFQIVPQRFPKEIGIVTGIVGAAGGVGGFFIPFGLASLKAATGTFTTGFTAFAALAFAAAILVTLTGRAWSSTFLAHRRSTYAFALEEG